MRVRCERWERSLTVNVRFKAWSSKAENCFCGGCHALGSVVKLKLPMTLYYDGKRLSTKYRNYWLCQKCLDKLRKAMDDPKEET